MVTFYKIHDVDKFFKMINCCTGRVLLKCCDEQLIDIRENALVRELLTMSCSSHGIDKLVLIFENRQDMPRVQRYLMDCHSKSSLKQIS